MDIFLPSRPRISSPRDLSSSSQAYLSIRTTSSKGTRTEMSKDKQQPSFECAGLPLCSTLSKPWGLKRRRRSQLLQLCNQMAHCIDYLCGGKSFPNISIMYFLRVEWSERFGLISQTGKWAEVFSETRTLTRLFSFFRMTIMSRRRSLWWGRMAGNCNELSNLNQLEW